MVARRFALSRLPPLIASWQPFEPAASEVSKGDPSAGPSSPAPTEPPPLSLFGLPEDVFLDVIEYLDIDDVASLLCTCTAARRWASSRSLWLVAIRNIRAVRPLPCATRVDPLALPLPTLRAYAHHARRLDANWRRARPRMCGAPRTVNVGPDHFMWGAIPGTHLVLLHDLAHRRLTCWDSSAGAMCASVALGGNISAMSQRYEEPGVYVVAFTTGEEMGISSRLFVVRIEYGAAPFRMAIVWEHDIDRGHFHEVVFFADVVGVIFATKGAPTVELRTENITNGNRMRVELDLQVPLDEIYGAIVGGVLYITAAYGAQRRVFRLPVDALPYTTAPPVPRALEPVAAPFHYGRGAGREGFAPIFCCAYADPFDGLRTVEVLHQPHGLGQVPLPVAAPVPAQAPDPAPGVAHEEDGDDDNAVEDGFGVHVCFATIWHGQPPSHFSPPSAASSSPTAVSSAPAPAPASPDAECLAPAPLELPPRAVAQVGVPGHIARWADMAPDSSPLVSSSGSWIAFCAAPAPALFPTGAPAAPAPGLAPYFLPAAPDPDPAADGAPAAAPDPASASAIVFRLVVPPSPDGAVPPRIVTPELPAALDLARVMAIKLDAYLGVLYLLTKAGDLHCVSYV